MSARGFSRSGLAVAGVAAALVTLIGCGGTVTVDVPLPDVDVDAEARNLAGRFDSRLALPFSGDDPWTVCRGYNIRSHSRGDRFALDLTAASGRHGPNGCVAGPDASDRRQVVAPITGTVAWFDDYDGTDDLVCINRIDEAGGGSVLVGHISPKARLATGGEVTKGRTVLGSIIPLSMSSQSGYAHIHIAAFDKKGCQSPVPFTGSFKFECVEPLASNGRPNQHQGVAFIPC